VNRTPGLRTHAANSCYFILLDDARRASTDQLITHVRRGPRPPLVFFLLPRIRPHRHRRPPPRPRQASSQCRTKINKKKVKTGSLQVAGSGFVGLISSCAIQSKIGLHFTFHSTRGF
jgi:hypothetical protein